MFKKFLIQYKKYNIIINNYRIKYISHKSNFIPIYKSYFLCLCHGKTIAESIL